MFDKRAFTGADCSIGGHTFRALLDSGARFPIIDPTTADLIFLKRHSAKAPDKPDTMPGGYDVEFTLIGLSPSLLPI
ncbi:MAG: hypothetical protein WA323_15830 [Candidatus Nitrosopolaris sp.]|jgi:hypothetical protein